MKKLLGLWVIFLALVPLLIHAALADTLKPVSAKYEFEIKDSQIVRSCHLLLILLNPPRPEVVKFTILFDFKKETHKAVFGFIADVGDEMFKDGRFSGIRKAYLSSSQFTSKNFNSVGRMYPLNMGDGGVGAATSDIQDAFAYLTAVEHGNFAITFVRQGSPSSRTYLINQPPPPETMNKFLDCVSTYH